MATNGSTVPIFAIPKDTAILMTEFRGLEVYASCAIAIYFYELVVCSLGKSIKWYNEKLWCLPEVISFLLEKLTTVIYCIITLIFLHYSSHTQLSCTILLLLQQGFFGLSTAIHCFILLIRFRKFYPERPYVAVLLFLFAASILLFQLIDVIVLGSVNVNKLDGKCYLDNALQGEEQPTALFPVGFVMLMIYCWIIWAFTGYTLYSITNSQYYCNKRYWRKLLFDNGFMYLSLIALSQAINVVFIFDGNNYLRKYINLSPLLVLTSICTQKLLINTKPINMNEGEEGSFRSFSFSSINSINEKNVENVENIDKSQGLIQYRQKQQSFETFIDQFYVQGKGNSQQQNQRQIQNNQNQRQIQNHQNQPQIQNYSQQRPHHEQRESYQNHQRQESYHTIKIPSPTHSSFTVSTKVNSILPSLPPIVIHRNTTSDIDEEEGVDNYKEDDYYTEYDEKPFLENPHDGRTTQDFGNVLLDYFNSLTMSPPVTPTNPVNQNKAARDSGRISRINRISNLNMNGSHLSLNNKSQQKPILVDPNDIYYFTYSYDDDNDVYLFPAIQIPNEKESPLNNNTRKSSDSLTPSVRHQSFAFAGKIAMDNNNLSDKKKIVRISDVQNILSKKKDDVSYQEGIQN